MSPVLMSRFSGKSQSSSLNRNHSVLSARTSTPKSPLPKDLQERVLDAVELGYEEPLRPWPAV